jgi:hypothetical protein
MSPLDWKATLRNSWKDLERFEKIGKEISKDLVRFGKIWKEISERFGKI